MKPCAKCGMVKALDEFHRDKRKADGRRSRCKACFNADQLAFQRRHKAETGQYYSRTFFYNHTCDACGGTWESRVRQARYCSGSCANSVRGYQVACEECGLAWESKTTGVRWCSPACARASRFSKELVVWRPSPWWSGRMWPVARPARRWYAGQCRRCSIWFVFDQPANAYCSQRCSRADSRDRRRARERDAFVESVSRWKIFERDKWICQLCKRKVNRNAVVPHPRAPVIDHVIPLARLGTHEPANVQCAHFMCNSIKSDRGGGEQLALIG